jgi:hypothetical protein
MLSLERFMFPSTTAKSYCSRPHNEAPLPRIGSEQAPLMNFAFTTRTTPYFSRKWSLRKQRKSEMPCAAGPSRLQETQHKNKVASTANARVLSILRHYITQKFKQLHAFSVPCQARTDCLHPRSVSLVSDRVPFPTRGTRGSFAQIHTVRFRFGIGQDRKLPDVAGRFFRDEKITSNYLLSR